MPATNAYAYFLKNFNSESRSFDNQRSQALPPHRTALPHAPQWPQLGTGLGQSKLPLPKVSPLWNDCLPHSTAQPPILFRNLSHLSHFFCFFSRHTAHLVGKTPQFGRRWKNQTKSSREGFTIDFQLRVLYWSRVPHAHMRVFFLFTAEWIQIFVTMWYIDPNRCCYLLILAQNVQLIQQLTIPDCGIFIEYCRWLLCIFLNRNYERFSPSDGRAECFESTIMGRRDSHDIFNACLLVPQRPGCSALCPGFAAGGMADELHVPSRGALRGLNLRPISLGPRGGWSGGTAEGIY